MNVLFGIYGASGCGRGVMPMARAEIVSLGLSLENLVFVDDNASLQNTRVNGHLVLNYQDFLAHPCQAKRMAFAIAQSRVREKLVGHTLKDGVLPWALTAQNVVMMDEVQIAEGAILSPFVTLTSNITVGRFFHANLYSYVEHDCQIGDFVTFAPGVHCNGNVRIEDHAYIGAGAIIRQGTPDKPLVIGKGAVVGMGAVVTKNVPAGMTVVGNPAKPLLKA